MNKPFLFLLIACMIFSLQINAQSYSKYMQEGKVYYNNTDYMTALERFDLAYDLANNQAEKNEAKSWKNKSREKIRQQQSDLKKTLTQVKSEKAKSDSLFKEVKAAKEKSEEMLRLATEKHKLLDKEKKKTDSLLRLVNLSVERILKIGTSFFDKAIKKNRKDWKGYDRASAPERKAILEKIDTLDLSANSLLILPKEVIECKNLKSLNLLGNEDLDWDDCFKKIEKLTKLNEIKISVRDFDQISSACQNRISGIEITKNALSEIPEILIAQNQLTYLDLSGNEDEYNNFTSLNSIINLDKLRYLDLKFCRINRLPNEIHKLINLNYLFLSGNQLDTLPEQLFELKNLTCLDLSQNKLKSVSIDICKLKSLKKLYFNGNSLLKSNLALLRDTLKNCEIFYEPDYSLYFKAKKYNKVIECYNNLINRNEQFDEEDKTIFAKSFNYLGDNAKSNSDSAAYYYNKANEIKPDFLLGRFNLGILFLNKKEWSEAINQLEKALTIDSVSFWSARIWSSVAPCYLFTKQFSKAKYAATKSLEINPGQLTAQLTLARAYLFQGDYEKAKEIYLGLKEVKITETETGKQLGIRQLKALEDAGVIPQEYMNDVEKIRGLMKE